MSPVRIVREVSRQHYLYRPDIRGEDHIIPYKLLLGARGGPLHFCVTRGIDIPTVPGAGYSADKLAVGERWRGDRGYGEWRLLSLWRLAGDGWTRGSGK